jgi:hypothetical protein
MPRHEKKEKKHKHDSSSSSKHHKKHDKKHHRQHRSSSDSGSSSDSSSSTSSSSDDAARLVAKAKQVLQAAGKRHGAPAISPEDDFLSRQPEFRVWLFNTKNECVSDVEKKQAHKYFEKFARKWNDGELPELFYKGIPQAVIDQVPRVSLRGCVWRSHAACVRLRACVRRRRVGSRVEDGLEFLMHSACPAWSWPCLALIRLALPCLPRLALPCLIAFLPFCLRPRPGSGASRRTCPRRTRPAWPARATRWRRSR